MNLNRVLTVLELLEDIYKRTKKTRFNYHILKNIEIIEKERNILNKVLENEEMKNYEIKRTELCKKYCNKDENDNPIIENKIYTGLDSNEEFKLEFENLNKENEEIIKEYQNQINEYNELLNRECEIKFNKISLDIIPDDVIEPQELRLLFPLIKES